MKLALIALHLLFFTVFSPLSLAADSVLLRQGDTVITSADVRLAVEAYVPEQARAELFASEQRLRDFIAQLFAVRKLAEEAHARPLAADERARIDMAAERAASQVQLEHLLAGKPTPDFSAAAHEFYLANPQQFAIPEQIRAQHVLIKTDGRSDDEARLLARHVLALAQKGDQDFADLAAEFSEDASVTTNRGDLGWFGPGRMVKPFEDAVFGLHTVGALAGPVRSEFGYHVIRLLGRKPAGTTPFDEVKASLIAAETARHRRVLLSQEYERVARSPGVEVDQEAIRALVQPIDFNDKTPASAR